MQAPLNNYDIAYQRAVSDDQREGFWEEQSNEIDWHLKPKTILDKSDSQGPGFWRWFSDGLINICHNCVDRHVKELGDQPALHWYSAMVQDEQTYSWNELLENVSKLGNVYKQLGVKEGDRIIIYMPMVPQAIFSMLASARIGAIHSVVFGGFAAQELSSRIVDAKPTLIVTASCGLQPNKIIDYKEILDEAIEIANDQTTKVLILQRQVKQTNKLIEQRDFDYTEMMKDAGFSDCTWVRGPHPLYILYTSGTTGQPKGIVRDQGGCAVAANWTMKHIMDIHQGETYFAASDIGWVVGHQFIVYGPLIRGATTVLYQGKPTGTPDPGAYWRLIEKYQAQGLYTAPTALRAIRKDDLQGEWIKKFDISSLTNVSLAGERCDIPTYEWIQNNLKVLINDNYWQTEIGWIISCNYKNLHTFKPQPGSCVKPAPGFIVEILDHENNIIKSPNVLGRICIKLPMPPNFMLTLYNNDEAFMVKYLNDAPGYYQSGDCGYFDADGYLNVMTRLDDIINTAGHRLSTASMEEVLLKHDDIVEAAVVAHADDLRGEIPLGFVVLKTGRQTEPKQLEQQAIQLIRKEIGAVAFFRHCIIVDKLPQTRSGKTLRHLLKQIADDQPITKIPPTIEDIGVIEQIQHVVKEYGIHTGKLVFSSQVDHIQDDDIQNLMGEEN